jgi:integrase/recombinase XerD
MGWDGRSLPKQLLPTCEIELWKHLTGPGSILADDGPAAEWRKNTTELIWGNYTSWLGWLHASGCYDPTDRPETRITFDRVVGFIQAMRGRNNAAATIYLRVLALDRVLVVLAPEADRGFLRLILRRLSKGGDVAAKRARLQETAALVDLGVQLMESVEAQKANPTRSLATLYRDGLQIALLALRPLRLTNFAQMEIGSHLIRRDGTWWLHFDGGETKNGSSIDVCFPPELVPWLEKYLDVYRVLLGGARYSGPAVWVSYKFTAEAPDSLHDRITKRTEEALGRAVNPHLFRDSLATSLATNNPELVGIAHVMLGNSIDTCQRYYNLARTHQAGTRLTEAIDSLKHRRPERR